MVRQAGGPGLFVQGPCSTFALHWGKLRKRILNALDTNVSKENFGSKGMGPNSV